MDPALADTLPLFAPNPAVIADIAVTGQWPGGYQAQVTLRNPGSNSLPGWELRLFLPRGVTLTDTWGAAVIRTRDSATNSDADSAWIATPRAGTAIVAPGATVTFGFVADTDPADGIQQPSTLHPAPELAPVSSETAGSDPSLIDQVRTMEDGLTPAATAARGPFRPGLYGFNMGSWWQGTFNGTESLAALAELAETGANSVALVPTRYVESIHASRIFVNKQTETDEALTGMMRAAKDLGLKVILKPHVHLADFGPHQRISPSDPDTFFADFTETMVHYARIAEAESAALMVLGGELSDLAVPVHDARWRRTIAAVRAVYSGPLTYAANWGDEFTVPFWDALDYIGTDMYAPLITDDEPTVEDVAHAWLAPPRNATTARVYGGLPVAEALRRLSVALDKPVLFTEIGWRSIDGAGEGKWDDDDGPLDMAEQRVLLDGFLAAMDRTRADWLAGVLFWQWPTVPAKGADPVPNPKKWSMAGKPAGEAVAAWFRDLKAEAPR